MRPVRSHAERFSFGSVRYAGGLIRVLPYDDTWPEQFAAERDRLVAALGTTAVGIEHVGSTAVPRRAAKPWIDIQVEVPRLEQFHAYGPALFALGYQHHPDDERSPRVSSTGGRTTFTSARRAGRGRGVTSRSAICCGVIPPPAKPTRSRSAGWRPCSTTSSSTPRRRRRSSSGYSHARPTGHADRMTRDQTLRRNTVTAAVRRGCGKRESSRSVHRDDSMPT